MVMHCNICDTVIEAPLFVAPSNTSVTSLSEVVSLRTRVWQCMACSHLSSDPMPDSDAFYAFDYKISLDSEDEDQVYEVNGDEIIYRGQHQMAVFDRKIDLKQGARVLDFGCAKATMMRQLHARREDADIHLFDVSRTYEQYWEKLVPADRRAVDTTPLAWNGSFDLVTSFFAFEHIPHPRAAIAHVHRLLKPGGVFYAVVPYCVTNPGDFIVVDHVSHFTRASLRRLLSEAGFGDIEVDTQAHRGALVVRATRDAVIDSTVVDREEFDAVATLAAYWQAAAQHLSEAEARLSAGRVAIYGAGFYGVYIYSMLSDKDRVACFIDRSPYLQGKMMLGVPVLPAEAIPDSIDTIFIGLNPKTATAALTSIAERVGKGIALIPLPPST